MTTIARLSDGGLHRRRWRSRTPAEHDDAGAFFPPGW